MKRYTATVHSIINRSNFVFVLLAVFSVFPVQKVLAQDPRYQIIEKEFDCIRDHLQAQKGMVWNEVCYSSGEIVEPAARMELINAALDQVSSDEADYSDESDETNTYITPITVSRSEPSPTQLSRESDYADEEDAQPERKASHERVWREEEDFINQKQQTEFGVEISHISYKEPIFNLKEKGAMYGFYASYANHMEENQPLFPIINMYKLEGKASFGSVDYESISGTIDDIPDYMIELRALLGYDMKPSLRSLVTPYAGLGFRYLNDDSSGLNSTTGAVGYERASHYLYLPIGFEFKNQFTDGWLIGFIGEFDVLLYGKQISYLSDVDTDAPDVNNDQKRGYGLRGSLQIVKKFDWVDLSLTPFIRYWHIKNSDVTTAIGNGFAVTGYEPDNNSTEFGVKMGVRF